jgi:hypothetical protein
MTDTTAALYGVTACDDRISSLREGRRLIRLLSDGIIIGVGTGIGAGTAVCALVWSVTWAALWITSAALATHPNLDDRALTGPAAIALADPKFVFASAADITGSIEVAGDPADAQTFQDKWSLGMVPMSVRKVVVELFRQPSVEPGSKVAALRPVAPAPAQVTPPAAAAAPVAAATPEKRVAPREANNKSAPLPDPDSRTAVYDISAHTVYLPGGEKLEAHSGLGDKLDDPRYVNAKDRGPTPPNVYDLALRGELFHEVRAIRLTPVGGDNMFGRDGILAHSYMLGPNGQSNGCVSFRDYPAFLHAYLRGEVDRLVVVQHLGSTPWRTASARGPAHGDTSKNP